MIVGACHSTSALVINPCTIANSFGAGYSTLHANRAGAGKALLRASCSKGSADSRSQPYGDPAQSTEDGADRPERTKDLAEHRCSFLRAAPIHRASATHASGPFDHATA